MQPSESSQPTPNGPGFQPDADLASGLPIVPPPTSVQEQPAAAHPLLGNGPVPSLQPFSQPVGGVIRPTIIQPQPQPQVSAQPPQPSPVVQAPQMPQAEPVFTPSVIQPSYVQPAAAQPATVPAAPSSLPAQPLAPTLPPSDAWFAPQTQISYISPAAPSVYSGEVNSGLPYAPPSSKKLQKPLLFAGVAALFVLLSGGYVFGIYIPNKPENVYKSAVVRTGKAADKLTLAGTEKAKVDIIKKGMDLSGTVAVDSPDGNRHSGSFSSRSDQTHSDSNVTYSPDKTDKDFSAQILTDLADGQKYPSVYFKLSGLSVLGADQYSPKAAQYDGKWISVTSSYLESLLPASTDTAQTEQATLTPEDVAQLTKIFITTTDEYLFTTDPTKNLLVNKAFKGTEVVEGQKSNHYIVGIHKAHAKDYCKALITNFMDAPAYKHLPGVPLDNLAESKKSAIDSCQNGVQDNLKESDTFDMWVSKKTKLIGKVRFTDTEHKEDYIEIGQTYTRGDILPLYTYYHYPSQHYDARVDLSVDLEKSTTKGSVAVDYEQDKKKWKVNVTLTYKPTNGAVKVTAPSNAIPIQQVLQDLDVDSGNALADPAAVSAGRNSKAEDTERQIDLKSLQGQLEAYYAMNGEYPQLKEVNNATWRSTNMKGLDSSALADPIGKKTEMLSVASASQYGYSAGGCEGVAQSYCSSYTLTAILSTGKPFTLNSLN
jgi:hypothetical protein